MPFDSNSPSLSRKGAALVVILVLWAMVQSSDAQQSPKQKPAAAADAYFDSAMAKEGKRDWDGAIADFTKAIELQPDDAVNYQFRAHAKHFKGDFDGAIADYTRSIALKPGDAGAFSSRGLDRIAKADFDGAIADTTKALELQPDLAIAFNTRGEAKYAKGDVDGAIADYTRGIELRNNYAPAYKDRGAARKAKGDVDGANADFAKASQIESGHLPTAAARTGSSGDLTDAQINAAIQQGVHHESNVWHRIYKQEISIKGTYLGSRKIYVLSASDRIAVAAIPPSGRRKAGSSPEFSVADARALGLDMVAVVLVTGEPLTRALPHKYALELKVDDKIIQPLPASEVYSLGAGLHRGNSALSLTFMFPAIKGAQRVTVIVTIGAGQKTIEKEADPRLFESR
jgi:tetratricopeptide (TPR) repeat protein